MGISLPKDVENLIKVEMQQAACDKINDDCITENKELLGELIPKFRCYLFDVAFSVWCGLPCIFSDEDKEKFTQIVMREFTRTFLSWGVAGFQEEIRTRINDGRIVPTTPSVIEAVEQGEFKEAPKYKHIHEQSQDMFDLLTSMEKVREEQE